MPNKSVLVLFSGGADSALLLYMANRAPLPRRIGVLLFDYGQAHAEELEYAQKWLDHHDGFYNEAHQLDLSGAFAQSASPLLAKGGEAHLGVHEKYVPARNMVFISVAASFAESRGYDEIWYGADYSDCQNLFPDCTQEWVVRMNKVLEVGLSKPVVLRAPLLGMTKQEVTTELGRYGADLKEIFSGYGER